MQMMLAAKVERGDVLFCSSLSGNNAEVIMDLPRTLDRLWGNFPSYDAIGRLEAPIDITNDGDVLGPACLRDAFLVAVDMLAYGAAIRNRAHAQEKLRRIQRQFTTYRDTDDSQPVSD
jgi:DNA-binding MurR/RpiR family transcriptional regulator